MKQLHKGWALAMVKDRHGNAMKPGLVWFGDATASFIPVFATKKAAAAFWRSVGTGITRQETIVRVDAMAIAAGARP